MAIRVTCPTAVVLEALVAGFGYGFEIIDATGLGAGTVYPILRRLENEGHVRSRWERVARARAEGRPPRRTYRLTASGEKFLEEVRSRYPGVDRVAGGVAERDGPFAGGGGRAGRVSRIRASSPAPAGGRVAARCVRARRFRGTGRGRTGSARRAARVPPAARVPGGGSC